MVKRFSRTDEIRVVGKGSPSHPAPTEDKTSCQPIPRGDTLLEALATDYEISTSPGIVLQALVIAARYREPIPEWVLNYFGGIAAPAIMNLFWDRGALAKAKGARNEAELVGKALGFSTGGRTAKSNLTTGKEMDQAWEAYNFVCRELESCPKEHLAFQNGAKYFGVSAATVRRNYLLVRGFVRQR